MDRLGLWRTFRYMVTEDISIYFHKHCRFRFRGGKEAYGVIWENKGALVFSSKELHSRYKDDPDFPESDAVLPIDSDDVLMAEVIS
ncbi:MAG: hypothetical protein HKN79_06820 [Flavobacteriales bacterium]|nr:hypothetical protein [Flavobacteriales bacterium]